MDPVKLTNTLTSLVADGLLQVDESAAGLSSAEVDELARYFSERATGASPARELARYCLNWVQFLVTRLWRHNFRRNKRARTIRKRLAKRLVRSSQHRFWVV